MVICTPPIPRPNASWNGAWRLATRRIRARRTTLPWLTAHLGRTLQSLGAAEAALQPLTEAQQRFQALAEAGDTNASRMASVAIMERGHCLRDLGRLDEAAAAYEDAIQRAEQHDDRRQIAVGKGQLGTVRMLQQRYEEALAAYQEALKLFDALGEPGSVAVAVASNRHGIQARTTV